MTSIRIITGNVGVVRVLGLGILASVALCTFAWILSALFRSGQSSRARSIASMIAITTTTGLWFGVAINHRSFAWQGKRLRMVVEVQQLESLTASPRCNWPQRDGDLPGIGPFMAYTFGRPTTLLLLQSPAVSGKSLCVAAIERQRDGAIPTNCNRRHGSAAAGTWFAIATT